MSKIDEHSRALALVREARLALDGSTLCAGEAYGGDGNDPPTIFFGLYRLEDGARGTQLEVTPTLAALLAAAFDDLGGDLLDKAVQIAEAREYEARLAAVAEAESFLLLAKAAR